MCTYQTRQRPKQSCCSRWAHAAFAIGVDGAASDSDEGAVVEGSKVATAITVNLLHKHGWGFLRVRDEIIVMNSKHFEPSHVKPVLDDECRGRSTHRSLASRLRLSYRHAQRSCEERWQPPMSSNFTITIAITIITITTTTTTTTIVAITIASMVIVADLSLSLKAGTGIRVALTSCVFRGCEGEDVHGDVSRL